MCHSFHAYSFLLIIIKLYYTTLKIKCQGKSGLAGWNRTNVNGFADHHLAFRSSTQLVGVAGFEPATFCVPRRRAPNCAIAPNLINLNDLVIIQLS